jgi:hypothetical protein
MNTMLRSLAFFSFLTFQANAQQGETDQSFELDACLYKFGLASIATLDSPDVVLNKVLRDCRPVIDRYDHQVTKYKMDKELHASRAPIGVFMKAYTDTFSHLK